MSSDAESLPIAAKMVYQLKQPIKKVKIFGDLLVSSSADSRVRVWSIDRTGLLELKATLKGHQGPATKFKLENGILYTMSTRDDVLKAWNMDTFELVCDYKGHEKYLTDFVVLPKENLIYTASFDGTIIAWELNTGNKLVSFEGHTDSVTCLKVLGKKLISSSADKTIRVWERKSGTCEREFRGHTNFIFGVHLLDKKIFSNSQDGFVIQWNSKTGEPKRKWDCESPVQHLHLGAKGFFAQTIKTVKFHSYDGSSKDETLYEGHSSNILSVAWYKHYLLTAGADRSIRAFNTKKGALKAIFKGHTGPTNTIAVRDQWVYTGSQDASIRLWENEAYLKEEAQGWV